MKFIFSFLFLFISLITAGQSNNSDQAVKDAVWHLEENYWNYVKTQDLVAYAKLWDEKFIGYPSNNKIAGKDHITDWISELYSDKNRKPEFNLERKVENVFDNIVIVFYDVNYTWRNEKNEIIELTKTKITHTWRKTGNSWLIIGGMGALISKTTNF